VLRVKYNNATMKHQNVINSELYPQNTLAPAAADSRPFTRVLVASEYDTIRYDDEDLMCT